MKTEAKNVAAIRKWLKEHRPDILPQFEQIMAGELRRDDRCSAMFGLLAIGFAAGREYQREHPEDSEP